MKTYASNTVEKTQGELKNKRETQRDNYNLGVAFLPLIGVIIWLGLVLTNALVIDQSKIGWQTSINSQTNLLNTYYQDTLITHGELVVKTNQLSGVIDKDIQPEQVFILVEKLFPEDPEFNVIGFGRKSDGSFDVTVAAPTFLKFSKIARRFSQYDKIRGVQVVQVGINTTTNKINGTINFFFTTVELNSATKSVTTNQ